MSAAPSLGSATDLLDTTPLYTPFYFVIQVGRFWLLSNFQQIFVPARIMQHCACCSLWMCQDMVNTTCHNNIQNTSADVL